MTEQPPAFKSLPNGALIPWETADLEWRLRYAPESITRADQLRMASICAAYRDLMRSTKRKRRVSAALGRGAP